jgi:hypothetical protein
MDGTPLLTSVPPSPSRRPSVDVVRCGPSTNYQVRALIVSTEVFGCEVHYAGRTVPCLAPGRPCKWCDAKRAKRWVGYVHATDPIHRVKRFLLELTAGVMPDLQRYVDLHDTLRNAYVVLTRTTNHPTARLRIDVQPHRASGPGELPIAGSVAQDLWRMWSPSLDAAEDPRAD